MLKFKSIRGVLLVGCFAAALPLHAQGGAAAQAVVTVMPKSGNSAPIALREDQLQIKVDNKAAQASSWTPLRGERGGLQLVVLVDGSSRSAVSLQFNDLRNFIERLPAGAQVGVAYMQNGRAVMTQNLTADHNLAAQAFKMPSGIPGESGSPYFCLSDLVKNWPGGAENNDRREVLMITDGVDLYYGRRYDPDDPYVQAAIQSAQKAGILVHSIFYRNTGRFDNSEWTEAGAQNYLLQVSQSTGGHAYWQGFGNPVSFAPFLEDLGTRLANQYELGIFAQPRSKAELQSLKVKVMAPGMTVDAPQMVLVPGSESAFR